MSVYKFAKSPFYYFDFQIQGHRFRGPTKTRNKKEAEGIESAAKAKAKADLALAKATGNAPLTVDAAAVRFWQEVGQHHSGSGDTFANLERLIGYFGKEKRLDEITDSDVAGMVAWRRAQKVTVKAKDKKGKLVERVVRDLSPSTVNRSTTIVLKALFTRAKRTWRYQFAMEPIWRDHMLKQPEERVRELQAHEAAALDMAVRPDYAPWLNFARATGLRLDETIIRWSAVNWTTGQVRTLGKGGKWVTAPITDRVREILAPLRGQHEEWVFTYIATRPRKGPTDDKARTRGKRYPITYSGAKTEWKRLRKRAGLQNFRFHDIRHDVGTKLLRQTGNLKLVQRALNHADLKTTARYAHVLDDEVAAALNRMGNPQNNPRPLTANAS